MRRAGVAAEQPRQDRRTGEHGGARAPSAPVGETLDPVAERMLHALRRGGRGLTDIDTLLRRGRFGRREAADAEAALADLLRRGTIVEPRPGRYALAANQNLRAGRVQVHPDGYAFLVAEDDDGEGRSGEDDLYIGGSALRPAMHGDRVLAAVERGRHRGIERSRGRVVRVLERRTDRLLGVHRRGRSGAYLVPQDPRVPYRVTLVEAAGAADGDMVVARITRYPGPYDDIEAQVEINLGPASDPRVETEAIIYNHDLPRAFPAAVREEAARVPATIDDRTLGAPAATTGGAAPDGASRAAQTALPAPPPARRPWRDSPAHADRVDLRALPLVTIDGENARDFDDAVAILDGGGGRTRLLVAIADVAAYVRRGAALDLEARARGTSVYFPDLVIPMLPEELSNGICSLNPGVDRLVQAVLLDCDHRGECWAPPSSRV